MNPYVIGAIALGALVVLKGKSGINVPGTSVSDIDLGFSSPTITPNTQGFKFSTDISKGGTAENGWQAPPVAVLGGTIQGNDMGGGAAQQTQGAMFASGIEAGAVVPHAAITPEYTEYSQYNVPAGMTVSEYFNTIVTGGNQQWDFSPNSIYGDRITCYLLNSPLGGGGSSGRPNVIKVGNVWVVKN